MHFEDAESAQVYPRFRLAKFRLPLIAMALLVGAVAAATLAPHGRSRLRYSKWWTLGAVQALEGPDEFWVFAEMRGVVRTPDPLVSPNVHAFATRQRVAVFDSNGLRRTFDINSGPTFNSNISCILRHDGEFYLFEGKSLSQPAALFVWSDRGFRRLERREDDSLRNLLDVRDARLGEAERRFESTSNRNGWERLCADNTPRNLDVHCKTTGVRVRQLHEGDAWRLVADAGSEGASWSAAVLEPPEPRA